VPGSTTTTTTTSPTTDHRTTITKGVDANGNEITKEDTYREGIVGSSESRKTTMTDPDGGTTTTRSKTTTKVRVGARQSADRHLGARTAAEMLGIGALRARNRAREFTGEL
jgi:hypothetical protein